MRRPLILLGLILLVIVGCSDKKTEPVLTVATPEFNIADGVYDQVQTVVITCETPEAEIRYTLDGTAPTEESTRYTSPLLFDADVVVKAGGFKEKWHPSEVATLSLIIDVEVEIGSIQFVDLPETLSLETEYELSVLVYDADENLVPDDIIVTFTATKGSFVDDNFATTSEGLATVLYDTGTSSGNLTLTASVGDIVESVESEIMSGLPAVISVLAEYQNPDEEWVLITDEIGTDFPYPIRLRITVRDVYNNRTPDILLNMETTMGELPSQVTTGEEGIALVSFDPGTEAGTALITVSTAEPGYNGEIIYGNGIIMMYHRDVASIEFYGIEEINLDVTGVGGSHFSIVRVDLKDINGANVSGQNWVTFEIIGEEPLPDLHFGAGEQSYDVLTIDGIGVKSIFSGTEAGEAILKVTLLDNPEIYGTIVVIVHPGPPANVELYIGEYDTAINQGQGIWALEAGAFVTDIHGNPSNLDAPVNFSLGADPTPPQNCYIDPEAEMTNGLALTTLYYHGINTNDQITIVATIDGFSGSDLFKLPVQQPYLVPVTSPAHLNFFIDNLPDEAESEIFISLNDGQGNLVNGAELLITTTHGYIVDAPDGIVYTENGHTNQIIRFDQSEFPMPGEEIYATLDVDIEVHLVGTHYTSLTHVTLRVYNIPSPGS